MEALLASFSSKTLERGLEVEGTIIQITQIELVLDLGTKSEGILFKKDISDEKFAEYKVGDKVTCFVEAEDESGQIILSLRRVAPKLPRGSSPRATVWNKLTQARDRNSRLSGRLVEVNKGGLIVEIEGLRAFLPSSQIGELNLKESDLVGQEINFSIIEVDQNNNRLIISQKRTLDPDSKQKLSKFAPGEKVTGKVAAVLPFALLINLDGVTGVVFTQDASWDRADLSGFKVGQEVEASILGVESELCRVNLSIKNLADDPFSKIAEKYKADDTVKGVVVDVGPAGVVVKLEDGVEGFVVPGKIDTGTSFVEGQNVTLLVDSVDLNRRKINLAPMLTTTKGLIYK